MTEEPDTTKPEDEDYADPEAQNKIEANTSTENIDE